MATLQDQAIKAALNQDWESAIEINLGILTDNPRDIATLNRLGFAYRQVGDIKQAQHTYQEVIKLDAYNPIALKNLKRLTSANGHSSRNYSKPMFTSFIEEPGKTKTIALVRPADASVLVSLDPGIPLILTHRKKRLVVETEDGHYLGCLPDDLAFRLIKLVQLGYQYQSVVKAVEAKSICIFIREISRGQSALNLPSFTTNSSQSLNLPKISTIDEVPIDVTPTGEEDFDEL